MDSDESISVAAACLHEQEGRDELFNDLVTPLKDRVKTPGELAECLRFTTRPSPSIPVWSSGRGRPALPKFLAISLNVRGNALVALGKLPEAVGELRQGHRHLHSAGGAAGPRGTWPTTSASA